MVEFWHNFNQIQIFLTNFGMSSFFEKMKLICFSQIAHQE